HGKNHARRLHWTDPRNPRRRRAAHTTRLRRPGLGRDGSVASLELVAESPEIILLVLVLVLVLDCWGKNRERGRGRERGGVKRRATIASPACQSRRWFV